MIQQGAALGLRTVRKVFLTDRSNLPRSSSSVASGGADLVQLMPWPVLAHVGSARLAPFGSFIAGGFVADCDSIEQAMDLGAVGVSTSDTELWDYTRPDR
ncbi:glycerol-3-phosphate responsive antiterminator [Pseudonocardia sp. MH-G8]|uniref:glycerol-3-phosphate responsive antiterminator n=1 Tax=Pseudonocardia sp. MH-G8 TaxID=1854588 RepID=UPI001304380F|nr:glycerol-3-phosphate responsive antiterminator [Pseudonocardia sp. MH-G8]